MGCRGVTPYGRRRGRPAPFGQAPRLGPHPSIFAGTNSNPSPDAIPFADTPSPPFGQDFTSSEIRR